MVIFDIEDHSMSMLETHTKEIFNTIGKMQHFI